LSPLRTPHESQASPQSLLEASPDSSLYPGEVYSRGEHLPIGAGSLPGKSSEAVDSPALATGGGKVTTQKPVLLLVEDNHINLKVCVGHAKDWKFLLSIPASISTDRRTVARNLYEEE
jgi:hypothetical protein